MIGIDHMKLKVAALVRSNPASARR